MHRASVDARSLEPRALQLYDEGAALLAAGWDEDAGLVWQVTPYGTRHAMRESLAYADVLLRAGDVTRAERIFSSVASMQETREGDAHYGNFRWFFEDACVTDLNAVEFALDHLVAVMREHAGVLSDDRVAAIRRMIALGLEEIDRLDVHPSYTNIALSDICNSVLGGELLDEPRFVERGRRRLDEWLAFTARSGAPHEYNSPTYVAVDIARMAALAEGASDGVIALRARVVEEWLWLHVAAHYHPVLAQLTGPHSRSYRDGWTGARGYLKVMLWRLIGDDRLRRQTPSFPGGREEGHAGIAVATYHCPAHALDWLREKRYPFEARETSDAAAGLDITTYMTASYALGTASRSYAVGEPPEPWPAQNAMLLHFARDGAPGFGTVLCRYVVDERDLGDTDDLWDEGQQVAAQHRNRAIVAYGLRPRMRPASTCKLSVRVLGVSSGAQVWCSDRRVDAFPATLAAKDRVVIAEGDVFIAIIPLAPSDMGSGAPIELRRVDGMLILDIYNYQGPAKTFWEHRSQAGPFYKGNVRNAFIIEVAERDEYASIDAFRRHIADATVVDEAEGDHVRAISYASEGGAIAMRYSLWDMRLIERRCNEALDCPPKARAGAVDGSGMQFAMSPEPTMAVGGATVDAGEGPKWLATNGERGRHVFVKLTDDPSPVRLQTHGGVAVEWEAFGYGRAEVDEQAGTVTVDATIARDVRVSGARAIDVRTNLIGSQEQR